MPKPLRVLIIEDREDDALLLVRALTRAGYEPDHRRIETEEEFRDALKEKWDIILADYSLPHFGALPALSVLQESKLDIPVIAISGAVSENTILAAIKAGAGDYLMKGNLTRLGAAVDRELREAAGRRERRRLEDQLRQAQKMEAVGRLAGGVAHDFNNLLTVITGYSDLLLAGKGLQSTQRTALEEIRKAAERGGALTHQLLAFSRRQPLAPKIIQVNELVANMEKMLRRLIGEDVKLIYAPAKDTGLVKTDPGQLEQVIMNLVVNARDAMPKGGKLTIESANLEMDSATAAAHLEIQPGPYVMLAISDNGTGMDAETLSHLFEPFFTTKAPGRGTGLGLATAYGIVRQSGGTISVYSESGHGTTVRIYLPRVPTGEKEQEGQRTPEHLLRGSETILVVEDESRVRKLIAEVLTGKGYKVIEAVKGDDALRIAEGYPSPIHLVVVDVVMPEMSGPEMVQRLHERRPEIRALFISGYTDEAVLQHGVFSSDAAFLQKPFLPNLLASKVRQVLNGETQKERNA